MNHLTYQPHIDSLRAIAVLAVIVFHINSTWLPGGFVGVDIFFVISGYLISSQLFKNVSNKTFSFKAFYSRRIRRIIPAAFSVIFITVAVAQLLMLPQDAEDSAASGIWSLLSLSNLYFWRFQDTGYFAADSHTIPLLHFWSLAVEEQFYIIWPIVLTLLFTKVHRIFFIALIIFTIITSVCIAEFLISQHHSFVYYMLPSRGGELLVGALLAALLHFNMIKPPSYFWALVIFWGSLIIILFSCLYLTSSMNFPGWLYFIPTIGAAAFIWSGNRVGKSKYNWIVVNPIMLWIGKISFSAYLVHWPLLAFYRYGYGEPTIIAEVLLFSLTFLGAWLNWKFVEEKFRYKKFDFKQTFLNLFLFPLIFIFCFCLFVMKTEGLGVRMWSNNYLTSYSEFVNNALAPNKYDYVCQYWKVEPEHLNDDTCIIGKQKNTNILLWGDSNAAHYIGILGGIAKHENWSFRNIQHAACPPVMKNINTFVTNKVKENCTESIENVLKVLPDYSTVIISADYLSYYKRDSAFMDAFYATVEQLTDAGKKVIILGKSPIFNGYNRHCLAKAISYPQLDCLSLESSDAEQIDMLNSDIEQYSRSNDKVTFILFNWLLCTKGCSPYKNRKPLYYDSSHIEMIASWELGEWLVEQKLIPKQLTEKELQ